MDNTKLLFQKIRGRDRASFDALTENYGWKLYSYIRKNTEDRAEADRIFGETFPAFYNAIENYDGDDPVEALLFSCADRAFCKDSEKQDAQSPMGKWAIGHESGFSLPAVDPKSFENKKEPLWLKICYGICIVLLVIGILAAIWVMAWMLMSMNLIPQADLGYSWFNLHIADLF